VTSPEHTYVAAGVYRVELAVTDDRSEPAVAARDVTVEAPLAASGPLAFSDSAIGFCYRPASTRSCVFLEEHIFFTSTGGKALKWTAVSEPWILIRPASGTTPTDVRVSVDMRKLPPVRSRLSVSGLITVSVSGASTSPQTIPVKLQFYAQPLPR
jgi:PKD repeat protein